MSNEKKPFPVIGGVADPIDISNDFLVLFKLGPRLPNGGHR